MSIGNDIVAIKSINAERVKLYSFYSKILPEDEQALYKDYRGQISFEIYVWLLWSIKESVYKCSKRSNPCLIFSPVSIPIDHLLLPIADYDKTGEVVETIGFNEDICYRSTITYREAQFHSHSVITQDFIHTVVTDTFDTGNIYWGIKEIGETQYQTQTGQVRSFVLNKTSNIWPGKALQIGKSESGYPYLLSNGQEFPIPLSFTHHENYVAYAFMLTGDQLPSSL